MWVAVPVPWLQDEQEAPMGGDAKKLQVVQKVNFFRSKHRLRVTR